MPAARLLLFSCFLLLLSGCMISEQIGEPEGRGTYRAPGRELTIHFDTLFNRILLFGRSGLITLLAFWFLSSWSKKAGSVLGLGSLALAGWLIVHDYPILTRYRIDVLDSALYLSIPPEPEMQIPWSSIEAMELAGYEWTRLGGDPIIGQQSRTPFLELPEWETMEIILVGGQKYTVNLRLLSIEQRHILSMAVAKQANLVNEQ
jgi:hypothetical protein